MNHDIYISLGSNLGNRKAYLQQAIEGIAMRVGTIVDIAPIYETPSWGFAGEAFLNTCLLCKSFLSPEEDRTRVRKRARTQPKGVSIAHYRP